jgi:hypothetical protein
MPGLSTPGRTCFVPSSCEPRGIISRELGKGTRRAAQGVTHTQLDPGCLVTTGPTAPRPRLSLGAHPTRLAFQGGGGESPS